MNDIHIINNYSNHEIHFLLNMKKSLERQNSYIFSLIEETNEYNSDYKPFLKIKQENTFLLTLQKQKNNKQVSVNNLYILVFFIFYIY